MFERVVDEAADVFVTSGTASVDGPCGVLTLGCYLGGHETHEERKGEQKLLHLGGWFHRVKVVLVLSFTILIYYYNLCQRAAPFPLSQYLFKYETAQFHQ